VIVLWLLHVLALATLPLLLAYFWNIKTIPVLAAGREGEENFRRLRYNPFKQYHALYQLIEAKKEAADQKYKDFSYGFWLFIPLFIFNPIGLNAFVLLIITCFILAIHSAITFDLSIWKARELQQDAIYSYALYI
jgi:hypothetical protein